MAHSVLKLGLAITVGLTGLAVSPAYAQGNCAQREAIIDRLKTKYGESLAAGGLQSAMQLIEIWTAPETGSWTILMTRTDGKACVIATGSNWHQRAPVQVSSGKSG